MNEQRLKAIATEILSRSEVDDIIKIISIVYEGLDHEQQVDFDREMIKLLGGGETTFEDIAETL